MVYILAISGPTAAGKTYFTEKLIGTVSTAGYSTEKISTDEFYHDLSHIPMKERAEINYDMPQSIDGSEFMKALSDISNSITTKVPMYDFSTHTRTGKFREVNCPDLLLVEGIFALSFPEVNDKYHLRVYIELDQDLRLIRRLERDMKERGRSLESIVEQYLTQVRPTQSDFVINDRKKADIILKGDQNHHSIFELIIAKLQVNKSY